MSPYRSAPAPAPAAAAGAELRRRRRAQASALRRRRPGLSALLRRLLLGLLASLGTLVTVHAQVAPGTLPTGAQVVSGSAQVQVLPHHLVVQQGSARLGLDWTSFSIGSAATVEFRQPGRDAVALNRVLGSDPSLIYGRLQANGQVFLSNPNGVLFAPGAQVDVGALVATTLDLSQQDFAEGRLRFAGGSARAVRNEGRIAAAQGGYVALFGREAHNDGEISVPAGSVLLASGSAATVSIAGHGLLSAVVTPGASGAVVNGGQITADGGSVRLSAQSAEGLAASLVNNSGVVRARSLVQRGGDIWITGDEVASHGRIDADGTAGTDGGRVLVRGGMAAGRLDLGGEISARAGAGGAGGQVETSAAFVAVAPETRVDTRAAAGRHGTWTIDPTDFTVAPGNDVQTASGIGAATLAANLALGNVELATAPQGGEPGDIHVNAPVSWSADTRLTLTAARHINLNASLTATGDAAGLVLTPGSGGSYFLASGALVTLSGSQPFLRIAGADYTVVNTLADLQAIGTNNTTLRANWALGSDIDASATTGWNGGAGFAPLGDGQSGSNYFGGRFEGFNHRISNLVIRRPEESYVGFIGHAAGNASVRHLELVGVDVVGGSYTGGLIGYGNTGTSVHGVRVGGQVVGLTPTNSTAYVGMLAGLYYGNSLNASSSSGVVFSDSRNAYVGGLAGYMVYGGIVGSSSSATVSALDDAGNARAGGLVGNFSGTSISDSSASGAVRGTYVAGGLVGEFGGSGSIVNSSASGAVSDARSYAGGLVGYFYGTGGVATSFASGSVSSPGNSGYAGGLVGYYSGSGHVSDSAATGAVSGGYAAGGLVGEMYGYSNTRIQNSRASGDVTSTGYAAGGLVGQFYDYYPAAGSGITGSSASGRVHGNNYSGGLVGYYIGYDGITGSHATGAVTGGFTNTTLYIGGLVGYYYNYASAAGGGIVGSYAAGDVALNDAALTSNRNVYAGGLVGYLAGGTAAVAAIEDSHASGTVRASSAFAQARAGGLVGYADVGVTRGLSTGPVSTHSTSATHTGGLIGDRRSTAPVVDSYWDIARSGQSISDGGSGLDATAVRQGASYVNWDLGDSAGQATRWRIYEGHAAPMLRGLLTPQTVALADIAKTYDGTASFGDAPLLNTSNQPLSRPELVQVALAAVDAGSYGITAAQVYSAPLGYDLEVSGSATLTINPRPLTLAGVVADKVYDGTRDAPLVPGAQPSGLVPGEDLAVDTAAVSAAFDTRTAGSGKTVTISGYALADGMLGKAANYSLANSTTTTASITPKPLDAATLTVTPRAYDGTTAVAVGVAPAGTLGGVVGNDQVALSVVNAAGTLADRHAGAGKPVVVSGVTLTGPDAGNYTVAGIADLRVDIAPKPVTANGLAASNRMYNGGVNVTVSTAAATVSGFVAGDTVRLVSQSLTGQMADANVGSAKPVSVGSLSLRGPDAANYTAVAGAVNVDITPRTVTVYAYSANNQASKVYDGTTAASATIYPDYNYDGNNLVVGSTSITYADKHVGNNKSITVAGISLGGSAAGNYTLVNASTTLSGNITPRPLAVTGVSAVNRVYDGTVDVAVNVGSAAVDTSNVVPGDDVSPQIPSSGVVTGTMVNKNVGTAKPVTVPGFTLGGVDAGNYTLSGTSGVTVDIARKPLTAVYTGVDKVYDGSAGARVNSSSADIVAGDQVLFYASAANGFTQQFANTASTGNNAKDVGTDKLVNVSYNYLYGSDANNYTLVNATGTTTASITPKGITPVFSGINKVYDGTADVSVTLNRSASGIVGSDDVGLTLNAAFTGGASAKNVGTAKPIAITDIAFGGPAGGNYTLSTTTASASASITPKPVGLTGVAAVDRAYDGTTVVALTSSGNLGIDGLVGNDVVNVVAPPSGLGDGTIADKRVGTAKPVTVTGLTLDGADAGNYTLDGSSGVTVDITPRPLTAVYAGVDRVYNGGVAAIVTASSPDIVTVNGVTDQVTFTQSANFTGDGARNAGTNKPVAVNGIAIAGADAANYALQNTTASTTASITPRPLAVSYTGIDRVYNGLADLSASVSGSSAQLVAGDTVVFTQTARFVGDGAAGTGKSIEVTAIGLGGTHAGNYSLTTTSAFTTASITPKALDVTGIAASDRVYDGSTVVAVSVDTANVDLSGRIGNDDVDVVLPSTGLTTGTMADKNVGSNKLVQVTGLTLTGAQAANYRLSGGGITVDITPKPVTAIYAGQDKVYDGSVVAQVGGSSAGFEAVDAGTVGISALGVFTGSGAKNVGSAKPVAVSGGFLTGVDRDNYTLLNPDGSTTAAITPRTITASYTGGSRVYDGGVDAPVSGGASGLVAGDQVAFTQTAVFTGAGAKNVGNNKPVAVSGITLTGSDAVNYALASTDAATTARITPRPLDIDGLNGVSAVDRVYDGTLGVVLLVNASGPLVPDSNDIVAGDDVTITLPPSGITTGTMADRHAGTGKAVVVDGLGLTGTDAGNYLIAATSGVRVDIAPKPLTALFAGVSRAYDGTAAATVTGSSADIVAGDAVAIAGSGVFTGPGAKNVGTGKAISVLDAALSGSDRGNYSLVNRTGDASADITPRLVTAVYTGGTRVYDGGIVAPVNGTAAGFVAGDSVSLTASAFFSDGKHVGTGKPVQVAGIALAGADAANYSLAATDATTTASVTPRPLTIVGLTGVSATNRIYDGSTQVEVIVASSGPVAPDPADLVPGDDVTVIAPPTGVTTGTLPDKNVGTARPVAVAGLGLAGADAGNYSVALTSGVTVDITPRPLTALWTGVSRVYDGTDLAAVTGSSADLLAGDLLTITGSGVFDAGRHAGSGKAITVTGGQLAGVDAANYSLVNPGGSASADITPRPLTASYSGGMRVYDGTLAAPVNGGSADLIAGDVVGFTQSAVFADKHVGGDKPVQVSAIALAGADAANYQLTATSATTTASIVPRPVTIVGLDNVVASSRAYDGTTTVAVSVNASGPVGAAPGDVIAGDDVQFQAPASGQTTGTMADKHVGTGKAVVVAGLGLSGSDAGNYRIAATQGVTVDITPRPLTALWTGVSRVYDGTDTAQVTGSSADLIAGDLLSLSAGGVFSTGKQVGTGKAIVVAGGVLGDADAANYVLLNPTGSASADITPRPLTALASGGTRVYDGTTDAPVTLNAADLIAGDAVAFTQTARFSDGKQVGNDKPVEVSAIALSGADAANYALTATTLLTTASVTPRPLSVTGLTGVSAVNRTYDGTTLVDIVASGPITAAGADVIAGDDVSVQLPPAGPTSGTMADKHAGTGKAVVLTGLTLAGADAGNYVIAGTAGVTVDIAPRPVTLSGLVARPRVYDGGTAVAIDSSAGSLAGALAGDDVALRTSGVSGSLADKHAGSGKAVTVDGLALQGSDAANYTVTGSGDLRVDIARRTLAMNLSAADKTYDGDTGASITLTDDRIAGDALDLTHAPAVFDSRNAGAGRTVTIAGLALAGADAANYQLAATLLTTTATIAPAPLTVAANSLVKFYGDAVVFGAGGFSATGLVAGETIGEVTLASAGAAAAAPVAGSPYALAVADARGGSFDPANYLTSYLPGTLTVQPRPLTIAANSVVRYADEPNPADPGWSVAVGALVGGDRIGGVQVALPPGSASAPGGSVLAIQPSGAVFTSGDAGNYELRYTAGLLVVLPKPPRIDEADPSAPSGDPRFAVLVDEAELRRALAALEREAAATTPPASPLAADTGVPVQLVTGAAGGADGTPPAELAALLSGNGQRISLPVLLRLPLISYDPELRRMIFGAAAPATRSPN